MITPVGDNILVEPILRMAAATKELRERASKSGILVPDKKPDNRETFEGIPNQGYVRFLPANYQGPLKPGDHVIFSVEKPEGFKHDGMQFFAIKPDQIVATIPDSE